MKIILTTLNLLLLITALHAQDINKANEYFNQQNWKAAQKEFIRHLKKNKSDSSAWYSLGKSQIHLGLYEEAVESLKKAKETNFSIPFVSYNLAKAYALKGDTENSLKSLKFGVDNGLNAFGQLKSDTAFSAIASSDQFESILQKAKENFYPCLKDEKRRHFDFWIGEWEVYVNDNKVGENSITVAEGGCAIHESYTTPRGYSGQSINYYDKQDEKWHQTWVGSGGGVLDYIEIDRADGMLKFQCDFLNQQGKTSYSRLTFTRNEDGTLRQLFENSSDGKSWTPGFDGLYKKRE